MNVVFSNNYIKLENIFTPSSLKNPLIITKNFKKQSKTKIPVNIKITPIIIPDIISEKSYLDEIILFEQSAIIFNCELLNTTFIVPKGLTIYIIGCTLKGLLTLICGEGSAVIFTDGKNVNVGVSSPNKIINEPSILLYSQGEIGNGFIFDGEIQNVGDVEIDFFIIMGNEFVKRKKDYTNFEKMFCTFKQNFSPIIFLIQDSYITNQIIMPVNINYQIAKINQ